MGDLAVSREGRISIKGRSDDMLKINGVRVYLSEIGRALLDSFPQMSHAYCVPITPSSDRTLLFRDPILVVFCALKSSKINASEMETPAATGPPVTGMLEDRELLAAIQKSVHLPPVPFVFEWLAELPLQPHSGKLDRQTLRRLASTAIDRRSEELSRESRLRATAAKHFGGELDAVAKDVIEALYLALETTLVIAPQDALHSLGLSSMSAILLCEALKEKGHKISLETLFSAKTVVNLVEVVKALKSSTTALETEPVLSRYKIVPFESSQQRDAAIELLSEGFSAENELFAHLDLRKDQLESFFQVVPFHLFDTSCSFLVFDARRDDGECRQRPLAMGFSMAHSTYEGAQAEFQPILSTMQLPAGLQVSLQLLSTCDDVFHPYVDEHRTRTQVGADGTTTSSEHRWLCVYYVVVAADVVRRADGEAAMLVEVIENETLRRARDAGYTATYTANMNPVTIVC